MLPFHTSWKQETSSFLFSGGIEREHWPEMGWTYLIFLMTEVPIIYKSIDLLCKSMDWFLYDRDLRHEGFQFTVPIS